MTNSLSVVNSDQLLSLLGIPRKIIRLDPDDVVRKNSNSRFGNLPNTFTVADLTSTLETALRNRNLPTKLIREGVDVELSSSTNKTYRGRIKLYVEFLPEPDELIRFVAEEDSKLFPEPISEDNLLGRLLALSNDNFPYHFIDHYGQSIEALKIGSPGWKRGTIRLNLEFLPAEPHPECEESPLDEIRKLMTDAS